jgi:hypothetical protein
METRGKPDAKSKTNNSDSKALKVVSPFWENLIA